MQLFYKSVWLAAVALPLWSAGRPAAELTDGMVVGVVLDLICIPWPYVLANFVKERGDRWVPPHGVCGFDAGRLAKNLDNAHSGQ
jgi:hypothetical protein